MIRVVAHAVQHNLTTLPTSPAHSPTRGRNVIAISLGKGRAGSFGLINVEGKQ